MKISKTISVILFFSLINLLFAEPKRNLEIIYDLIEKNVGEILTQLPHEIEPFNFEYSSLPEYESLENRYIYSLNKRNLLADDSSSILLKYSLDEIGVLYSEPFRGGLLNDYKVERKIYLNGTFALGSGNKVLRSNIVESVYKDTLYYSQIEEVETRGLLLTEGTKPAEPMFDSLLEPVIAVGAVIVTIILLFTVRDK